MACVPKKFNSTDEALLTVIRSYTREAGVRNLEREIGSVCRKVVTIIAENKTNLSPSLRKKSMNFWDVLTSLVMKRSPSELPFQALPQVWLIHLWVEMFCLLKPPGCLAAKVSRSQVPLGNVMQESAHAALSFVRSRAEPLKLDQGFFEKSDIHLHIPAGAQPKDGPSAGVTMATALVSLISGQTS